MQNGTQYKLPFPCRLFYLGHKTYSYQVAKEIPNKQFAPTFRQNELYVIKIGGNHRGVRPLKELNDVEYLKLLCLAYVGKQRQVLFRSCL